MILIDTSVWIDYFKGGNSASIVNDLIDRNSICINDLILAELIPSINLRNEQKLANILYNMPKLKLEINWSQIISFQSQNLKNGINKVGIPDLIIMQNAIDNGVELFSMDKHFSLMSNMFGLRIFSY